MLIAAGEIPHRLHRRRRFDVKFVDIVANDRIIIRLPQKSAFGVQLRIEHGDVVLYGQTVHDPLPLSLLRQQPDAVSDRIDRRGQGKLVTLQNDLATVQLVRRKYRAQNLRAAGADKPGQPDHLPLV